MVGVLYAELVSSVPSGVRSCVTNVRPPAVPRMLQMSSCASISDRRISILAAASDGFVKGQSSTSVAERTPYGVRGGH